MNQSIRQSMFMWVGVVDTRGGGISGRYRALLQCWTTECAMRKVVEKLIVREVELVSQLMYKASYVTQFNTSDPMRITKKYSGSSAVGKQTFIPCEDTEENKIAKRACEEELIQLELKFVNALSAISAQEAEAISVHIADGKGSWFSLDEVPKHLTKKSKIHKSASAPALCRLHEDLMEDRLYSARNSILSAESRTRHNSYSLHYTDEDAAAGK
jgi:hypothetical protein